MKNNTDRILTMLLCRVKHSHIDDVVDSDVDGVVVPSCWCSTVLNSLRGWCCLSRCYLSVSDVVDTDVDNDDDKFVTSRA